MANPRLDPRCFEALDAPEADEVTCSKSAEQVNDAVIALRLMASELRVTGEALLRMAERLRGVAG